MEYREHSNGDEREKFCSKKQQKAATWQQIWLPLCRAATERQPIKTARQALNFAELPLSLISILFLEKREEERGREGKSLGGKSGKAATRDGKNNDLPADIRKLSRQPSGNQAAKARFGGATMLLSVVKRCPSCGKLVPIADMVGADGESQRCNACVSAAMVERGNKMHDAYLQSLMRTPRNELVAIGEQRTRAISRAILKRDEKRVKSEKNRARRAEMGLR